MDTLLVQLARRPALDALQNSFTPSVLNAEGALVAVIAVSAHSDCLIQSAVEIHSNCLARPPPRDVCGLFLRGHL
jgi:hypothetical protein